MLGTDYGPCLTTPRFKLRPAELGIRHRRRDGRDPDPNCGIAYWTLLEVRQTWKYLPKTAA